MNESHDNSLISQLQYHQSVTHLHINSVTINFPGPAKVSNCFFSNSFSASDGNAMMLSAAAASAFVNQKQISHVRTNENHICSAAPMSGLSLQSIVAQGSVEVVCGAMVATYTGGLNAESRPHGFGGR